MGRPIHIYRIHPFRYYDNNKFLIGAKSRGVEVYDKV